MARRLVSTMIRMKGGPTLGGSGTRITVYNDEALTVVSTLYQRSSGAGQQPNALPTSAGPHFTPNAGKQTTLRTATLTTDTVLAVVAITGFAVGDMVPIYNGTDTVFRVITALNAVGPTMTVDSAVGVAFATANTLINRPSMRGHIWFWVDDLRDYFIQPYDVGAAEKMPPLQIPTQVPTSVATYQEEGAAVGARAILNFVGGAITAADDAPNARVNVTVSAPTQTSFDDHSARHEAGGADALTATAVRAYHNANQSIANNTLVILALNSERYDSDGFHDTVTNNSRLTVPASKAGKYHITAGVEFPSAAGRRDVEILLNGATVIGVWREANVDSGVSLRVTVCTTYDLAVGDYVEVRVVQGSGAALDVTSAANHSPEFMMHRVL